MDEKLGKGGTGLQPIDKHGKYLSDSKWGKDDIFNEFIKNNPEVADAFNDLSDEEKDELYQQIKDMLDEDFTEQRMEEKFRPATNEDFDNWGAECLADIQKRFGDNHQKVLDAFYSGYKGAGQRSFNFNSAVRRGYQAAYADYLSRGGFGEFPSEEEVNSRAERLDALCQSYSIKENIQGRRFVDENWLTSMCGDLLASKYKISKDPWGYDTIGRDVDLDDLCDFLKNNGLVGTSMDGDSGFTSISFGDRTHMGKHVDPQKVKRIKVLYNLPKGQNMFVSQYQRENEVLLPRKMKFFIQDISTTDDDVGGQIVKRLVMTLGVR